MNKAVKIILAIAIALLYPIVVFLMTMVIFPDSKSNSKYPYYPNYNDCYSSSYSTDSSRTRSKLDESCRDEIKAEYDQSVKDYEGAKNKATASRIKVVLVFVALGFLVAFLARGISAVSAGFLGGSTILLLFASGFSVASSKYIDIVTEILFLTIFILLVVLFIVIDKVFPELPPSKETQQVQPKESTVKPVESKNQ